MSARSFRGRLSDSTNIWPGFVDILATLLIVIIFILMVFTVSQIYLSDAISGRDKALDDLRSQINELSKILVIESTEKQQVISKLESTEQKLYQPKLNKTFQDFSDGIINLVELFSFDTLLPSALRLDFFVP